MSRIAGFERVWRLRAADGFEDRFEQAYGSTGPWAELVREAERA